MPTGRIDSAVKAMPTSGAAAPEMIDQRQRVVADAEADDVADVEHRHDAAAHLGWRPHR